VSTDVSLVAIISTYCCYSNECMSPLLVSCVRSVVAQLPTILIISIQQPMTLDGGLWMPRLNDIIHVSILNTVDEI
jgi:hypothetical protein